MKIKGFIYDSPKYIPEMEVADVFVITREYSDTNYADIYRCIKSDKEKKFLKYKMNSLRNLYLAKKEDFYGTEYTVDELEFAYINFHKVKN